jgi:hypothetical protein
VPPRIAAFLHRSPLRLCAAHWRCGTGDFDQSRLWVGRDPDGSIVFDPVIVITLRSVHVSDRQRRHPRAVVVRLKKRRADNAASAYRCPPALSVADSASDLRFSSFVGVVRVPPPEQPGVRCSAIRTPIPRSGVSMPSHPPRVCARCHRVVPHGAVCGDHVQPLAAASFLQSANCLETPCSSPRGSSEIRA